MQNVEMKVVNKKLILEIDLTKEFGPSSSGKTIIVGTSQGNAKVPGFEDVMFGLNVYKKK